jgi:hypothetical protein
MSSLPNSDFNSNSSFLVEKGQALYENQLKATLEPHHFGEFVAIEPVTGRYFLGDTATSALVTASKSMPKSQFFLMRVGYPAAHKIGGPWLKNRVK